MGYIVKKRYKNIKILLWRSSISKHLYSTNVQESLIKIICETNTYIFAMGLLLSSLLLRELLTKVDTSYHVKFSVGRSIDMA